MNADISLCSYSKKQKSSVFLLWSTAVTCVEYNVGTVYLLNHFPDHSGKLSPTL